MTRSGRPDGATNGGPERDVAHAPSVVVVTYRPAGTPRHAKHQPTDPWLFTRSGPPARGGPARTVTEQRCRLRTADHATPVTARQVSVVVSKPLDGMGINERALDYQVSVLRNDIVDYHRVVRLTTTLGSTVFIAFPPDPPDDWLQFTDGNATVYLPAADFDATYRVLDDETPVFVTTLILEGIRAFNLSSGPESPGQGTTDPAELRELLARADAVQS